jgi:hypothetical protein
MRQVAGAFQNEDDLPDSIFSMSSMLLTSQTSLWLFARAIVSRRIARAGKVPPASLTRRPSAPAIEVSGVCSSWLTVAMNSVLQARA